jgi:hypothetical protein
MVRSNNAAVGASRPGSFDWLEDYDKRAKELARANCWTDYSFFTFARLPHLQPASTDLPCSAGAEWFSSVLAFHEKQIAQHPKAKVALNGLSEHLKKQLAALESDIWDDLQKFVSRRDRKQSFSKLAAQGDSWSRMLRSKHRTACQAVEGLLKYCSERDSILSGELRQRATAALKALRGPSPPEIPSVTDAAGIRAELAAITHDPTTEGMAQLYWFFRSGCKLSGHESEVRTALIRNAFWTQLGIPEVKYREKYQDAKSRGCDAVKQAVRRFKPH